MKIAGRARAVRHWFADPIFRRIFKNATLLLTGRATTGVLVLVQTYVQVDTAFAIFAAMVMFTARQLLAAGGTGLPPAGDAG